MDLQITKSLIKYIIDQLRDQEAEVSKIRLVKLLFLVDLEHFRRYRSTLTTMEWIAYRFGPYSRDVDVAIKALGLELGEEEFVTQRGFVGTTYAVEEPQSLEGVVPFAKQALIDNVIKTWAHVDLNYLLDYVYFDTEPMESAQFGQPLDFSTARTRPESPTAPLRLVLSEEKLKQLREILYLPDEEFPTQQSIEPFYDEEYFKAFSELEEENLPASKIEGKYTVRGTD